MDERLRDAISKLGQGGYRPGSSACRGWLYNPLPFPGCEGLHCHRANSHERWNIIAAHTDFRGRSVLDLGCATGYFSFKAIQAGAAKVLGIDRDPAAIGVCRAAAHTFSVHNVKFSTRTVRLPSERYDVTLAMSVLNWMGRERAEEWLSWMDGSVTWVEMPLKGDGRRGASWLRTDPDIGVWLEGFFSTVQRMGETYGTHCRRWRSLWRCN